MYIVIFNILNAVVKSINDVFICHHYLSTISLFIIKYTICFHKFLLHVLLLHMVDRNRIINRRILRHRHKRIQYKQIMECSLF